MIVHDAVIHTPTTREAILAAALELFAERGFHGTAVPLIAERAGIAAGTLYRHFASKEALVNVLYRGAKERLMGALTAGFPATRTPRQQFRWYWFRIAEIAREHPTELAFLELHHHGSYLDAESLAVEARSFEFFDRFMDLPATRLVVRELPARALVTVVWGILAGLFKACQLGHLPWDDALVAEAEICAWQAIARAGGEDGNLRQETAN
jgi:AcrR family transcriptional regulator